MAPCTFQLAIGAEPDAPAVAGTGVVAAFVPAADSYPSLVTIGCDPRHDPGRPIEELAPAAVRHVFDALGRPDGLRWAVIDTWGRFFEASPTWVGDDAAPLLMLRRFPGGIGIEAFLKEFGAAGEAALEMLSSVVDELPPLAETPDMLEFLDAIEYHGNLPAPGALFRKVEAAAAAGDAKAVAAAIQLDPMIAATLINYANAARFGGAAKTASVFEAIQRLGTVFVRRIVFVAEMMARYRQGACADFDYAGYWRNAVATAAAMRGLMPIYEIPPRLADDAFTAGLVSGLGWLAVAETYPALMSRYLEAARAAGGDPGTRARAQRDVFPCPIRRVTERYLTRFEFPESIREAVAESAPAERSLFDCLAGAVRVAQALSPLDCLVEPAASDVPDSCREEWQCWQSLLAVEN
jgi:HD-like signal output (HDOD) protein